jgi:hypothetical protein
LVRICNTKTLQIVFHSSGFRCHVSIKCWWLWGTCHLHVQGCIM